MEDRKIPPAQRGNIDGIRPRRPDTEVVSAPAGSQPVKENQQETKPQAVAANTQQVRTTTGKKSRAGKNWLVIIPAIIIFLGLSGFAVYTGLQKKSDGSENNAANSSGSNSESKQLIDQTLNEIDQLSGQPDNSGEGLSDEQLGL